MTRLYIVFLSLILLAGSTQAQSTINTILQGRVLTTADQPIVGASIVVKGRLLGTTSDTTGTFHLELSAGRYVVVISAVGMAPLEKSGTVKAGAIVDLGVLRLKNNETQLAEVVVLGKTEAQQIRESGFAVSAIDARRYAGTTIDINQILNRTTGVRIREEGGLGSTYTFSLNGLSGRQVKFFLDGIPLETFGNSLTLNNFPANLVQRMEVYKGVVPVSLGSDALGGAVNVVTNQRIRKFLDASYSYGSFNTHRAALSGQYLNDQSGLIVRANAFFNYSDNNYLMRNNPEAGVAIQQVENGRFITRDSRRFHDTYQSAMGWLEAGFANKKWADLLLIGFLGSNQHKQIQTARIVDIVVGKAHTRSNYTMSSVRYKKADFLLKGLSFNAYGSYGQDKITAVDTSTVTYWWNQATIPKPSGGELGDRASLYHYTNSAWLSRLNLKYEINPAHSMTVNYNFSDEQRQAYDERDANEVYNIFDKPAILRKNIIGLSYQANLLDARLSVDLFTKYFGYSAASQVLAEGDKHDYYKYKVSTASRAVGYGSAWRYKLTESIGIRASFEHAYRLPDTGELFGDGLLNLPNMTLQPEVSDNINAGAYFSKRVARHHFSVEGAAFHRNATNFITSMPVGAGRRFGSVNVPGVLINGFEADLKYHYNNALTAGVNASYQRAIDNQETLTLQGITVKNNTYKNRLPNQPWFFGNLDLGLGKDNLLGRATRLQLDWTAQYVHWFYLSWEAFGKNHAAIPSQLIHSAAAVYTFGDGKYTLSLECKNLTDALAYDNFRLQKPGRSVFIKVRYLIN